MTNNVDQFDVFLSHNWGTDSQQRDNHARVRNLSDKLTAMGVKVWFDGDQLRHGMDINIAMDVGIKNSKVIFCFSCCFVVL